MTNATSTFYDNHISDYRGFDVKLQLGASPTDRPLPVRYTGTTYVPLNGVYEYEDNSASLGNLGNALGGSKDAFAFFSSASMTFTPSEDYAVDDYLLDIPMFLDDPSLTGDQIDTSFIHVVASLFIFGTLTTSPPSNTSYIVNGEMRQIFRNGERISLNEACMQKYSRCSPTPEARRESDATASVQSYTIIDETPALND